MADREDDFLARWSRRKAEARRGLHRKDEDADAAPAPGEPGETGESPAGDENRAVREARADPDATPAAEGGAGAESDADAAQYEDFDFDSLDYNSDYTRFMEKGVPEAVRRRALRMLWQSDPVLANIDGLNDYDEDFTDAAMAVKGVLKSAYRPGKGYATDEEVAEQEKQRLAEREDAARKPAGAQDQDAEGAEDAETARARDDGEAEGAEDAADEGAGAGTEVADAGTGGDAPEAHEDGSGPAERHDGRHEKT